MSYAHALNAPSRRLAHPAARQRKAFSGLGALSTMSNQPAYYICYIEQWDKNLGLRKYYWSPIKYLSNWDALGFASSNAITQTPFKQTYQMSTLYEWNGSSWQKSNIPRM